LIVDSELIIIVHRVFHAFCCYMPLILSSYFFAKLNSVLKTLFTVILCKEYVSMFGHLLLRFFVITPCSSTFWFQAHTKTNSREIHKIKVHLYPLKVSKNKIGDTIYIPRGTLYLCCRQKFMKYFIAYFPFGRGIRVIAELSLLRPSHLWNRVICGNICQKSCVQIQIKIHSRERIIIFVI
jgi:hypothetical protein